MTALREYDVAVTAIRRVAAEDPDQARELAEQGDVVDSWIDNVWEVDHK